MFLRLTLCLFVLPLIEGRVYLYNTHDRLSVEFYDCITDTNLPYCRRPSGPITLQREQSSWYCDHDGIVHNFSSLYLKNITVSTVLHQWSSTIEKAEEYSHYIKQRRTKQLMINNEKYLCECTNPQSFGKHCEYLLPMGTTFQQTINWEVNMRTNNIWDMQRYSDIVCYTTLNCDSGLLCLDWRDICDGVQHCMYGYDEENCDKLEFNECEDDEYRCANGMCIPDEYFLDGEHDCADTTDEKEMFDDSKCTFAEASFECDDRMCLRFEWSCGDGQCILFRLGFQFDLLLIECNNLRDQYHMCETHFLKSQWTLPNGKCYQASDYQEIIEYNRTDLQKCLYFVKCALSQGGEINCPCNRNLTCLNNRSNNPCRSFLIQYPNGAIIGPYAFSVYGSRRDWSDRTPDRIDLDGTVKCRGYMIEQHVFWIYTNPFVFPSIEMELCVFQSDESVLFDNNGYDEFCYSNSRTFNNRPYHFIDVCEDSKECISAYRIGDGHYDCEISDDETLSVQSSNACSNMQHHRLRCSNEEPSCLLVIVLGDEQTHCKNARDEWWINGGIKLSNLICNEQSKEDCASIRQYIGDSWNFDTENSSDQQSELLKIPFRAFCDTFWDSGSKEDENVLMCHKWWKCLANQWQCRSGQCIEVGWVLDGEWDCVDASDEEALFFSLNNLSSHNFNLINNENLIQQFHTLYGNQSFWNICDLSVEYPCFRMNISYPLDIQRDPPCISLNRIGDGHVDCAGGFDERNNLKHCLLSTMLGYHFQCSSIDKCPSYHSHCSQPCDDDHVQCFGYKKTSDCSEENDFMCLDGECAQNGWCNRHFDCSHGEDELFCSNRMDPIDGSYVPLTLYRMQKGEFVKKRKKTFELPQIPIDMNIKEIFDQSILMLQNESKSNNLSNKINPIISYYCNRGIGVELYNESIVCLCPPQYYGDKCEFHNDRMTFLFHLNLSQSIYAQSSNPKAILKILIIFLHNNQTLMTESIQLKVADEKDIPQKKRVHFFYSRSNLSLIDKRSRYFNRSNIISEHPYSIRIEAYEIYLSKKARIVGVWLYPIYLDFLPSFRLSKVLHLTKRDTINDSCSNNPCNSQQECHLILNQNSTYVCLCRPNFKGDDCSIIDEKCERDFCSSNALCKPNYQGTLMNNEEPYCICPLNEFGRQCGLIRDQCDPNPCQNNGTCHSNPEADQFICLCDIFHSGDQCQFKKLAVRLQIKNSPSHRAAVVQYFDIDFYTLDLLLVDQIIYDPLPDFLHYLRVGKTAPALIMVKFYSDAENEIYLISIQINVESINGTIALNKTNRCVDVQRISEKISPFKYHDLCIQNRDLFCFMDNSFLCICEENHNRVECLGYDPNLDQCSSCLADGKCLTENRLKSNLICLCPRCYYGSLCQFSNQGIGLTLDSLVIQISSGVRFMYFVLSLLIFFIGGVTNYATIVTFKRLNLRKTSMGIYMLILSMLSQYSLFSLILKIILILFSLLMNNVSCKIISYLHSVSIRCSFWIMSLIAIERVSYVLFPYSTVLKRPRVAAIIITIIISIVGLMHVHELVFYRKLIDLKGQSACVIDLSRNFRFYDRVTVLIHYLIPFSIQILSVTILIVLAARSRSRTNTNHDPFIEYLKNQFQRQKELYIPPLVIIISGLPQMILSFSLACLLLLTWQQHALLVAYIFSFTPQLIAFFLFVLPSSTFIKEFQATNFSKTIFFRWITSKNNQNKK